MTPTAIDFKNHLSRMLAAAEQLGFCAVEVKAGDLHRRVGGYPGTSHRMPICCNVLRQAMKPGDEVVKAPPSKQGASVVVRFQLPR